MAVTSKAIQGLFKIASQNILHTKQYVVIVMTWCMVYWNTILYRSTNLLPLVFFCVSVMRNIFLLCTSCYCDSGKRWKNKQVVQQKRFQTIVERSGVWIPVMRQLSVAVKRAKLAMKGWHYSFSAVNLNNTS